MGESQAKKIGVIINPIAGLGGRVGLKGSDGADIVERALALGGKPESSQRASYALEALKSCEAPFELFTWGGDMGESVLRQLGFNPVVLGGASSQRTKAADTIDAARAMRDAGMDIGDTLIGMQLKPVAIPLRLNVKRIGKAHLLCARTRPKFIGGSRAEYDDRLAGVGHYL